jgi:hypothetical protein
MTQPFIDGISGWMSGIFDEGAIDGEPLRSDSNASSPAKLLEVFAPLIDICCVSEVRLLAIDYHVRIIII